MAKTLTYEDIVAQWKKLWLGNDQVNMFAKAHNVTPPMQPIQSNVDKSAIVTNAGSAVDPTTGNNYQAWYAIKKNPNVATPGNAALSKPLSTPWSIQIPDYADMQGWDKTKLQDYIDAVNYQSKLGNIAKDDVLRGMRAQRMLDELNSGQQAKNPYEDLIAQQEQERIARNQSLTSERDQRVNQYDQYLNSNLQRAIAQANENAARETQAQQSASSFSGFGRSTFNQDQIGQIQKRSSEAINALQQAKDLELERYRAEQEWADAKTLEAYDTQINAYKGKWAEREQSAIQHTIDLNNATSKSNMEKLTDALAVASQTAKNYEDLTDQDKQLVGSYATVILDDKGNIDKDVLSQIPAGLSAYVINEAAKKKGTLPGAAPDIQQIGKNKYGYFKDGKLVEINPRWGWVDVWNGNWSWYNGWWAIWNATDLINYNVKFKNIDQSNAFTYATRMIEASQIFNNLEKDIAWLSKSEYIAQKSLWKLPYGSALQSDVIQQQEQAERNFINATLRKESGATISPSEYDNAQKQYLPQPGDSETVLLQKRQNRITALKWIAAATGNQGALSKAISAVSSKPSTTSTNKPVQYDPVKINNFTTEAKKQGATDKEIKDYIAANQAQFR